MTTPLDEPGTTGAAPAPATLLVCVTCRRPGDGDDHPRAGARFRDRLAAEAAAIPSLAVVGVECLSNCKRGCTAALAGDARWTYVYGDLDPDTALDAVIDGARRYVAAADGLVPWRERPEIFRKGVIARVPALPGVAA